MLISLRSNALEVSLVLVVEFSFVSPRQVLPGLQSLEDVVVVRVAEHVERATHVKRDELLHLKLLLLERGNYTNQGLSVHRVFAQL